MSASTQEEERFDVLNADGSFAGYSKPRSAVHYDGDWHRSTHIWVVNKQGEILVQQRSELKDTFPVCRMLLSGCNFFDIGLKEGRKWCGTDRVRGWSVNLLRRFG